MADKKNKKPKHTNLVVPGDEKPKKDAKASPKRSHATDGVPVKPTPPQPEEKEAPHKEDAAQPQEKAAFTPPTGVIPPKPKGSRGKKGRGGGRLAIPPQQVDGEALPGNAVALPKKRKKKLSAARRRRRFRRIRAAAVLVLAAAIVVFFTSGAYLAAASAVSDSMDSLRIALRPGDGFPMSFAIIDYVKSETMGKNGFVALGAQEAVLIAPSGLVLRNVPHTYLMPGVSAGDSRVVLYNRGGKEYTVEGRSKTLTRQVTEHDIQFCEMSPGGSLAVVTSSRHRSYLNVYGPAYDTVEADFTLPLVDDKPVLAAFQADNRSLALGCLSAQNGELGTTIYLLHTSRRDVQGSIREGGAVLLQLEYTDSRRILAVYDNATVVYNQKGEELARYGYGTKRLLTANIQDGQVALVFGTTTREMVHTVLLDQQLAPMFEVMAETPDTPQVLAARNGAYLLAGQDLFVYNSEGALVAHHVYQTKALGLAYSGQPLAVVTGSVEALEGFMRQDVPSSSVPGSLLVSSVPAQSGSMPQSGVAAPPGSDTSQQDSTLPLEDDAAGDDTGGADDAA